MDKEHKGNIMTPHDKILKTLCDNDNASDGEMTMLQHDT